MIRVRDYQCPWRGPMEIAHTDPPLFDFAALDALIAECAPHEHEEPTRRPRTCLEPGCQKPVQARGLCSAHYARKRKAMGVRPHKPYESFRRGFCPDCLAEGRQTPTKRGRCPEHTRTHRLQLVREWRRAHRKTLCARHDGPPCGAFGPQARPPASGEGGWIPPIRLEG